MNDKDLEARHYTTQQLDRMIEDLRAQIKRLEAYGAKLTKGLQDYYFAAAITGLCGDAAYHNSNTELVTDAARIAELAMVERARWA